jgi:hypothetical protein
MDETPPEVAPFDPSDPGFVLKNMLQTSGRESRRLPNLCLQGVRCLNGGNCIPEAGKYVTDFPYNFGSFSLFY